MDYNRTLDIENNALTCAGLLLSVASPHTGSLSAPMLNISLRWGLSPWPNPYWTLVSSPKTWGFAHPQVSVALRSLEPPLLR
jgi:hypothetical protein